MEAGFRHDFGKVRVHADDQARRSAEEFGTRAYAIGDHIVFGSGEYAPNTPDGRELLWHELIHVTEQRSGVRGIRFWSKKEHQKLTSEILEKYRDGSDSSSAIRDPLFDSPHFYGIVNASFDMDVTPRRILGTGPLYALSGFPIIGPLFPKGEGPRHGEDGNYRKERDGKDPLGVNKHAREENVTLQNKYVDTAIQHYRQEVTPEVKHISEGNYQVTPPRRVWIQGTLQVTRNAQAMYRALGDACHVAQDRGAHWEGTKGMGHDDLRAKRGTWDPDNPKDNEQGEANARRNTLDVFKRWDRGATKVRQ
jgi:hypothetical protein